MGIQNWVPALGFLLAPTTLSAQSLDWAVKVGSTGTEIAYGVIYGTQSRVITVGYFVLTVDLDPGPGVFNVTSNGSSDVYIQCLDSVGGFLWGGSLGAGGADWGYGVATDAQGNVYFTGRASGTFDLDPGPGVQQVTTANTSFDAFVVKLDADGGFIWGRLIGGNGNEVGYDIASNAQGEVFIVGVLGSTADLDPGPGVVTAGGNGLHDAFAVKLDTNGDFVWGFSIGGTGNDLAYGVHTDASGQVLVSGVFRNTIDLDPGPGVVSRTSAGDDDLFVLKLNSSGALVWGQAIGGTGSERAQDVASGSDGGVVLTGRISSPVDFDPGPGVFTVAGDFSEPAFVCKLNSDGTFNHAFMLKGIVNEGLDVKVDVLNNAYVVGTFGTVGTTPMDIDPGPGVTPLLSTGGADSFVISYTPGGALNWGGSASARTGRMEWHWEHRAASPWPASSRAPSTRIPGRTPSTCPRQGRTMPSPCNTASPNARASS